MKKLLILALAGWISFSSCSSSRHADSGGKHRSSKADYKRAMRENYKQRKKMDREARRENKRNWGQNKNGDVFGIYK